MALELASHCWSSRPFSLFTSSECGLTSHSSSSRPVLCSWYFSLSSSPSDFQAHLIVSFGSSQWKLKYLPSHLDFCFLKYICMRSFIWAYEIGGPFIMYSNKQIKSQRCWRVKRMKQDGVSWTQGCCCFETQRACPALGAGPKGPWHRGWVWGEWAQSPGWWQAWGAPGQGTVAALSSPRSAPGYKALGLPSPGRFSTSGGRDLGLLLLL